MLKTSHISFPSVRFNPSRSLPYWLGVLFTSAEAEPACATGTTLGARAFVPPTEDELAAVAALDAAEGSAAFGALESPVAAPDLMKPVGPSISPLLGSTPRGEPFLRPSMPCICGRSSRLT